MNPNSMQSANDLLQAKYRITALFYDILDYYWERQYRHWRPAILQNLCGDILEVGVGTGRNLCYYPPNIRLTAIDLSREMLKRAAKRVKTVPFPVILKQEDATQMTTLPSNYFDALISTFLCCVMPDLLQPLAIEQFSRVLKPGGRFRLLEMVYSKDPKERRRQELFAPFVEKVFGARFDRGTLRHIEASDNLRVTKTSFLKKDIYLFIEGVCEK